MKRSFYYLVPVGLLTGIMRVCQAESSVLSADLPLKRDSMQDGLLFSPWLIGALCVLLLGLCVLRFVARAKAHRTSATDSRCAHWRAWFSSSWFSSSWFKPSSDSRLRIVTSCRLPQGASLQCIEWEGQRLLLSCTSQGVHLLAKGESDAQSASKNLADIDLDTSAVSRLDPAEKLVTKA